MLSENGKRDLYGVFNCYLCATFYELHTRYAPTIYYTNLHQHISCDARSISPRHTGGSRGC